MHVGDLLDDGGLRVGQLLSAVAIAVALALFVAVLIPVMIIGGGAVLVTSFGAAVVAAGPPPAPPLSFVPPRGPLAPPLTSNARDAVQLARQYLGVRYRFGGTDPSTGLDCSGLVQLVYRQMGITLPRTAQLQYNATAHLAAHELQPGDLVFFAHTYSDPHDWITHVGIYIGDGQQINAPTEGQVVSVQPVFSGFWGAHFVSGGRVYQRGNQT